LKELESEDGMLLGIPDSPTLELEGQSLVYVQTQRALMRLGNFFQLPQIGSVGFV
jgi:hypothetical protein